MKNVKKIEYVKMLVGKKQGKKKSKNPARGNSVSKGQVVGIGILRGVLINQECGCFCEGNAIEGY